MILKIAWLNIWRSPLRSFVVMGSVMIGVWAVIAMMSFSIGMVKSYVNSAIRYQTSYFQIHHSGFLEDQEIKYYLENPTVDLSEIAKIPNVESATARSLVNGMLSTARGARGLTIRGVDSETEKAVTQINEKVKEGQFLSEDKNNEIVISERLAGILKLTLRKKIVLQFQDVKGDIVAGAFRIVGLFDTDNAPFDEGNVFINRTDLNRLIGKEGIAHEIAVFIKDPNLLTETGDALKSILPDKVVENYREISPDVQLYESQIDVSATIFIFIFMLALIFGIINTMLMAVLERTRELGVLMSIGMNKFKVFSMIVIETIILGMIGTPVGLFLGWLTVGYFKEDGLDLSEFSGGMEQFGISTIIIPEFDMNLVVQLSVSVFVTAVLASLYPAYKAVSLRPVEAIRKI
jgi:ABC-type lipoprotein release transport system permease subunit